MTRALRAYRPQWNPCPSAKMWTACVHMMAAAAAQMEGLTASKSIMCGCGSCHVRLTLHCMHCSGSLATRPGQYSSILFACDTPLTRGCQAVHESVAFVAVERTRAAALSAGVAAAWLGWD